MNERMKERRKGRKERNRHRQTARQTGRRKEGEEARNREAKAHRMELSDVDEVISRMKRSMQEISQRRSK
jgi:hypothetical protein